MQLLLRWAVSALALYVTVWILEQAGWARITAQAWYSWLAAAIIMGLVNALIRPIARLITAPLNCLTFGLIGLVVNALLFALVPWLAREVGIPVFEVNWLGALAGSILMGLVGGVLSHLLIREGE